MTTSPAEVDPASSSTEPRKLDIPLEMANPFAVVSLPAVRLAAERVAAERLYLSGSGETDPRDVEQLAGLARALCDDADGYPFEECGRAEATVRRRMLDALRAELVRTWTAGPPPDAAEMLRVMSRCEEVRRGLDPEWDTRVGSRFVPPEGLEFLVEVAHDLRSPLTSILFLVETLRRGQSGEINELQRRQLGLIYSAALGIVSLASDLVELAHGGDRLMESAPSPFSVAEVLDSVCDIVRPMAEEKRLALRVLPPAGDQRVGYAAALNRVLLNLTANALKYTEDGFVELVARPTGPATVEFSVRDTGRGLSEKTRQHLYEPFHREGDSYSFSGTGLGLAISRKLVEAMDATLQYETSAGWGTRFFFELGLPPARL